MQSYFDKVAAAPRLSDKEHKELLWKYRNNNDKVALEKLTLSMGRLVIKRSRKMKGMKSCENIGLDELIQAGNEGLLNAIRLFKGDRKSTVFLSYASMWIKGAHWKLVQNKNIVNPKLVHMSRKHRCKFFYNLSSLIDIISTWCPEIKARKRREFSNRLNIPIDMVIEVESRYNSTLCNQIFDEDTLVEPNYDESLNYQLLKEETKRTIDSLKETHKKIIIERFFTDEPKTVNSLAKELGVHRRTIDQRRIYALKELKAKFESNPIIQELISA
jgi:RNA polymerase sigma factor (sigma-70 family)